MSNGYGYGNGYGDGYGYGYGYGNGYGNGDGNGDGYGDGYGDGDGNGNGLPESDYEMPQAAPVAAMSELPDAPISDALGLWLSEALAGKGGE